MRLLHNLVFRNLGLKISSLAIALALWAAYNSGPVVEVSVNAPLALVNMPDGLEVTGEVPAAVGIRLRGRSVLLRRLQPGDLNVNVDCGLARTGGQTLRLLPSMVDVPFGAEVVDIIPPEIAFSLMSSPLPHPQRK